MHDRTGRPLRQPAYSGEERLCFVSGYAEPGVIGVGVLIQITPQLRILVAIEAIDGRKGIDSLAQLCREKLDADPFSGCLFIFRNRSGKAIRILAYDGQGFWIATKRLSKGRFKWWPTGNEPAKTLRAHQAQLLLAAGNPDVEAAPVWRRVSA
jgi:transposase